MNDRNDPMQSMEWPNGPRRPFPVRIGLRAILWAIAIIAILFSLLLPFNRSARPAAYRAQCSNNLKQISLALANYADEHGTLPPAYIAAEDGTPMHSWRVLILPFMGSPECAEIYAKYRFDEPWDGPNNRKLADRMPYAYRCPGVEAHDWFTPPAPVPAGITQYVALVGELSAFPGSRALKPEEIRDGTSNTLAVVELDTTTGVPWMAPRDIDWAGFFGILSDSTDGRKQHVSGTNAAFADGSVRFLKENLDRQTLYRLMTADGGETVSADAY